MSVKDCHYAEKRRKKRPWPGPSNPEATDQTEVDFIMYIWYKSVDYWEEIYRKSLLIKENGVWSMEVSVKEARNKISILLDRRQKGEEILILRRGKRWQGLFPSPIQKGDCPI